VALTVTTRQLKRIARVSKSRVVKRILNERWENYFEQSFRRLLIQGRRQIVAAIRRRNFLRQKF